MSKFFKALEQAERDRAQQQAQHVEAPASDAPPNRAAAGARTLAVETETPSNETSRPPTPLSTSPAAAVVNEALPPVSHSAGGHPGSGPGATGESTGDRRDESAPHRSKRPAQSATAPLPSTRPGDVSANVEEHLVSLLFPATFEAEQYRALRHVLEQHRATSGLAVVAITSASVGDGKTTTAINLAGALAQAPGARVLLIDADLRRPSIAEHLGLVGPAHVERPGLVDILTDSRYGIADVVESRTQFNLSIIPAGLPPRAPYEVLQSARFTELIEEARRDYDYVILDTPPLVAVPDGRLIIKEVDGFVLVVRAHRTPRKLVEEALGLSDPQKCVGLVFNSDDRPLTGYYRGYHTSHPLSRNGNGHGRLGRILRSGRRNGTD
jgi:protein-tyrosine kinase